MNATVSRDLPDEQYFAIDALSQSVAKWLLEPGGPARWRWEHDHPAPPKAAFDFGHAAHQLMLGRGTGARVIPSDILASNGAASTREAKAFIAETRAAGLAPIKADEDAAIHQMADALTEHRTACELLTAPDVMTEVGITASLYGVTCKGKIDAVIPGGPLVDYKTSRSADPARFARSATDYGYHLQAAHYASLCQAAGITDEPLVFVVQEKDAPYLVSVIELHPDAVRLGRQLMQQAADIWRRCHATGDWPGYPDEVIEIDIPAWAYDTSETLDPTLEAEMLALINAA